MAAHRPAARPHSSGTAQQAAASLSAATGGAATASAAAVVRMYEELSRDAIDAALMKGPESQLKFVNRHGAECLFCCDFGTSWQLFAPSLRQAGGLGVASPMVVCSVCGSQFILRQAVRSAGLRTLRGDDDTN